MKLAQKLNRNRKRGFTLVEIIVVLVILAILAALLVPSLIGYIDKANDKKIVSEARQVLVAMQTIVSENYALNKITNATGDIADQANFIGATGVYASEAAFNTAVLALAEVKGAITVGETTLANGKVSQFLYESSGKTIQYTIANGFEVVVAVP